MQCGYVLATRIILSVPGIIDLLPPKWRPDLTEAVPDDDEERNVEVAFTRMELAITITSLRERFPGGSETADRLGLILDVEQDPRMPIQVLGRVS